MSMKNPEYILNNNDETVLDVVHPICCGVDVHKEKISACMTFIGEDGKVQAEIKEMFNVVSLAIGLPNIHWI